MTSMHSPAECIACGKGHHVPTPVGEGYVFWVWVCCAREPEDKELKAAREDERQGSLAL